MDNCFPEKSDVGGRWFQLYILKTRAITERVIKRAEAAGYSALCLTVDCVIAGKREANARNRFTYPHGIRPENYVQLYEEEKAKTTITDMNAFIINLYDTSIKWSDIEWIKSITSLPIILKGILSPADAKLAVKYGVAAIVISNHGGRQLDTAPATIACLPNIVEATKGSNIEIILDGGIRRGSDIVKAIGLGATCVMIGRPVLWGLATSGERGVLAVLQLLRNELKIVMQNCGCRSIKEINRELIVSPMDSKL